jgi:hypothetical protein
MSPGTRIAAMPRILLAVRILGYFLFVGAFFLPAVRTVAAPGTGAPDSYQGSFCAWITLLNTLNAQTWHSKDFLAILSGWINPLMILYVAFLFSRKLRYARRVIAGLVILYMAGTWVYFYLTPLVPLIGHVLWILGILMILAPETVSARQAPQAAVPDR